MSPPFFGAHFDTISVITMIIQIMWYACYPSIGPPTSVDWKYVLDHTCVYGQCKIKKLDININDKIHTQQKHIFSSRKYWMEHKA